MTKETEKNSLVHNVLPQIVIGISILLATLIASWTFSSVKTLDDVLTVTGSTKQEVISDRVKWTSSVTRRVLQSQVANGYGLLAKDLETVKGYLKQKGFAESEYTISQVYQSEVWKNNDSAPKEIDLRQVITLLSDKVDQVTVLSKTTSEVVQKGVNYVTDNVEYSYSKLADLRVSMLKNALVDARARAESIVETTGQSVGKLKSASSGVVQVLPQGSQEVSDYGAYDTGGVKKDVMVTVRAVFNIK